VVTIQKTSAWSLPAGRQGSASKLGKLNILGLSTESLEVEPPSDYKKNSKIH